MCETVHKNHVCKRNTALEVHSSLKMGQAIMFNAVQLLSIIVCVLVQSCHSKSISLSAEPAYVQNATPHSGAQGRKQIEGKHILQTRVKKNVQRCLNKWLWQVPMALPNLEMCKIIQDLINS